MLVKLLREAGDLDLIEHQQCTKSVGKRVKEERVELELELLEDIKARTSKKDIKRLNCIGDTVAWLTVAPSLRKGTVLSADKWRDNTRLRDGLRPHKL